MASITTLVGTDGVTTANSMTKINTNFANLNSDKIETSYLDTDTSLAANSDVKIATQKAVKAYIDSGGNTNASETTRGVVEEATDAEVAARTATGGTGARLFLNPSKLSTLLKFGGTGADGALTITSGATNIDLASAAIVVKNYSSISITGTGSLTFTNPNTNGTIIVLKSQGAVTLTSSAAPMIDASNCGAAGGTAQSKIASDGNEGLNGNAGSDAYGYLVKTNTGAGTTGGDSPVAGVGGAVPSFRHLAPTSQSYFRYVGIVPGAGGGGGHIDKATGGTGTGSGGTGGRGGGGLVIECAGAWNFTTASGIKVGGSVGGNASVVLGTSSSLFAGGGGGGGGGSFVGIYGSLTANSGTVNVSGGTGGASDIVGTLLTTVGGGGGGGASTAGTNGTSSSADAAITGGTGGDGYSLIAANTDFA